MHSKITYNVVVLAADRAGRAGALAGTDNGDGRAAKTDLSGDVLEDDPEEGKDGRASSGVGLNHQGKRNLFKYVHGQ